MTKRAVTKTSLEFWNKLTHLRPGEEYYLQASLEASIQNYVASFGIGWSKMNNYNNMSMCQSYYEPIVVVYDIAN